MEGADDYLDNIVVKNALLDHSMAQIQEEYNHTLKTCEELEKVLAEHEKTSSRLDAEIITLELRHKKSQENIDGLKRETAAKRSLNHSLSLQIQNIRVESNEVATRHQGLLESFTSVQNKFKQDYEGLPWIKKLKECKLDNIRLGIELKMLKQKLHEEKQKIGLFNQINTQKKQLPFIELAKFWLNTKATYKLNATYERQKLTMKKEIDNMIEINENLKQQLATKTKSNLDAMKQKKDFIGIGYQPIEKDYLDINTGRKTSNENFLGLEISNKTHKGSVKNSEESCLSLDMKSLFSLIHKGSSSSVPSSESLVDKRRDTCFQSTYPEHESPIQKLFDASDSNITLNNESSYIGQPDVIHNKEIEDSDSEVQEIMEGDSENINKLLKSLPQKHDIDSLLKSPTRLFPVQNYEKSTSPFNNPSSPFNNPTSPLNNPNSPFNNPTSPFQKRIIQDNSTRKTIDTNDNHKPVNKDSNTSSIMRSCRMTENYKEDSFNHEKIKRRKTEPGHNESLDAGERDIMNYSKRESSQSEHKSRVDKGETFVSPQDTNPGCREDQRTLKKQQPLLTGEEYNNQHLMKNSCSTPGELISSLNMANAPGFSHRPSALPDLFKKPSPIKKSIMKVGTTLKQDKKEVTFAKWEENKDIASQDMFNDSGLPVSQDSMEVDDEHFKRPFSPGRNVNVEEIKAVRNINERKILTPRNEKPLMQLFGEARALPPLEQTCNNSKSSMSSRASTPDLHQFVMSPIKTSITDRAISPEGEMNPMFNFGNSGLVLSPVMPSSFLNFGNSTGENESFNLFGSNEEENENNSNIASNFFTLF